VNLGTVPEKSDAGFLEEGCGVVLLMPRYPTFFGRLVGKVLHRSSNIRVKLDELGSETWRLIDGRRTIREIGAEMQEKSGDTAESIYPRLVEFLNILHRNRFIVLREECEAANVE
jgi:hypothetical protein